jgi:hypothetical protein
MSPHCLECGYPGGQGQPCAACGAPPAVRAESLSPPVDASAFLGASSENDVRGLAAALQAFHNKDYQRMVGQCLAFLGLEAPTVTRLPNGHGWSFRQNSAAIYLTFDVGRAELVIESPIVRAPAERLVPLMRQLLELNRQMESSVRFCLRGSIVLLRFVDRLENLSPLKVVDAVGWVATMADRFDDALAMTYAAPMIGPEARRGHFDFKFLGQARGVRAVATGMARALATPVGTAAEADPMFARVSRPQPLPSSQLGAQDAAQSQHLATSDALCVALRAQVTVANELIFRQTPAPTTILLVRASLYRLLGEFGQAAPTPISYLVEQGAALLPSLPPLPQRNAWHDKANEVGGMGVAMALPSLFLRVAAAGGRVPTPGTLPKLVPFTTALEVKAHLHSVLEHVALWPESAPFGWHVLHGTLHELALRATLPPSLQQHVALEKREAEAAGTSPAAVERLKSFFQRIAG